MTPTWVEHRVAQARRPPEKPDVTAPDWVAWFERSMLDEPGPEPPTPAPVAAPAVPPTPAAPVPAEATAERVDLPRMLAPDLVVIAVLVALLVLGGWWWNQRDESDPATQVRRVDAPSRTQVPSAPVSLPSGGRHTQVVVTGNGSLEVQVWQRSRDGLTSLGLTPPEGGRVSGLVVVDGKSRDYVRYRLAGALERAGTRALARLPSLAVGGAPSVETIAFSGATVLSLACVPTTGGAVPVPCGTDSGAQGWQVVGAGPGSEVLVQLDLPS
jgi:hypothetical protein